MISCMNKKSKINYIYLASYRSRIETYENHFAHLSAGNLVPSWSMVRAPSAVCRPVLGVAVPVNVVAVAANVIV